MARIYLEGAMLVMEGFHFTEETIGSKFLHLENLNVRFVHCRFSTGVCSWSGSRPEVAIDWNGVDPAAEDRAGSVAANIVRRLETPLTLIRGGKRDEGKEESPMDDEADNHRQDPRERGD